MGLSRNVSGSCALCGELGHLQRSHIVPESMYKGVYDKLHRYRHISLARPQTKSFQQKGIRERLLCNACEQKFSVWEQYGKDFVAGYAANISGKSDGHLIHCRGVDYAKLKLFAMSILWRSGVSAHPFFGKVSLGTREPTLRAHLLRSDPGAENDFPLMVFGLVFRGAPMAGAILQPQRTRIDGALAYRFVFGGIMWALVASRCGLPMNLREFTVSPAGDLWTMVCNALELQDLAALAKALGKPRAGAVLDFSSPVNV